MTCKNFFIGLLKLNNDINTEIFSHYNFLHLFLLLLIQHSKAGGGSGGNIYIETEDFTLTGWFYCNGGSGSSYGGGGAGGRVTVYFTGAGDYHSGRVEAKGKVFGFRIILDYYLVPLLVYNMSRRMGKPTICICENKGADQAPLISLHR